MGFYVSTSSADGKPTTVTSSDHPPSVTSSNPMASRPMNSAVTKKPKATKSVWRKGNPVVAVQRVVKVEKKNSKMEVVEKEEPQPVAPLKAQTPPKVQPVLQAKLAIAGPPVKKLVIQKDVDASPKPSVSNNADVGLKTKEQKPILRDKFAAKKPVVNPMLVKAVIPPPKQVKSPANSKVKDEHWKKVGAAGGVRRDLVDRSEIHDEASELGVPISRAKEVRKGRKWNKASRKVARLEAAKVAAPFKVEILEVREEGMLRWERE